MKGARPKPTQLRILQGNPGKHPINIREPKPAPSVPECPPELSADAKAEWARLSEYLFRLGMITEADRAAFAGYCQAYGRWLEAERILAEEGEILITDKGNSVQNPWLWVANRALEQMYKFLIEFGLSPASRCRLKITPPTEDEMEAYLNRGKKIRQQG